MEINHLNGAPDKSDYYKNLEKGKLRFFFGYSHFIWDHLEYFINSVWTEIIHSIWPGKMSYVSSSRADIKRIYDMQSNDDFTHLMKTYFDIKRIYKNYLDKEVCDENKYYIPESFINKWISKFGIGKSIKLEIDEDGAGVKIRLIKNDGKKSLMANEGYGITQLISILLQIECAIQGAKLRKDIQIFHLWVLDNYKERDFSFVEQTIAIEEPEIHLHPRYQSLLADMFLDAFKNYNIHFIIETHSEYLIRGLQLLTAKSEISSNDISVCYVESEGKLYNLDLQQDGKFKRDFGSGFFDEADNAAIELFEINNQ